MLSETSSTASASTISPRAASPPTAHGWPSRCWPHNLARWTARIGLGRGGGDHQDPPAALLLPGRTAHPLGPPPHFASATGLALGNPVHSRAGSIASPAIACLTAPTAPDTSTRLTQPTHRVAPARSAIVFPCMSVPARPQPQRRCPGPPSAPPTTTKGRHRPHLSECERGPSRPTALTPCSNPKAAPHRWIRAYVPTTIGTG